MQLETTHLNSLSVAASIASTASSYLSPSAFLTSSLIPCMRALSASVTAVAAAPRSLSASSSPQAAWGEDRGKEMEEMGREGGGREALIGQTCAAMTIFSTAAATSLQASISCSWHSGESIQGARTLVHAMRACVARAVCLAAIITWFCRA